MATNEKAINLETLGAFKDEADKAYQAKLTAGENITISEDNVISASGGGMSTVNTAEPISGDGSVENPITISELSPLLPVGSLKLEAGDGIKLNTDDGSSYISIDVDGVELVGDEGVNITIGDDNKVHIGIEAKGTDETILYEGSGTETSYTLSEPHTNFEYLRITFHNGDNCEWIEDKVITSSGRFFTYSVWPSLVGASTGDVYLKTAMYIFSSDTSCSLEREATIHNYGTSTSTSNTAAMYVKKIVGINRKA